MWEEQQKKKVKKIALAPSHDTHTHQMEKHVKNLIFWRALSAEFSPLGFFLQNKRQYTQSRKEKKPQFIWRFWARKPF